MPHPHPRTATITQLHAGFTSTLELLVVFGPTSHSLFNLPHEALSKNTDTHLRTTTWLNCVVVNITVKLYIYRFSPTCEVIDLSLFSLTLAIELLEEAEWSAPETSLNAESYLRFFHCTGDTWDCTVVAGLSLNLGVPRS